MSLIFDSIRLLRPSHWIKNGFVFLPLFFGRALYESTQLYDVGYTFLAFCMMASSIYIINDIRDVAFDKAHPTKKNRPFASGSIPVRYGLGLSILLTVASLSLATWVSISTGIVVLLYYSINIIYTLKIKQIPYVDVLFISLGFILRLVGGSTSSGIVLSYWIIMMTFLLSLFLALAKRREDVQFYKKAGVIMRSSITAYSESVIDVSLKILGMLIALGYIAYTLSPSIISQMGTDKLYLSAGWVILGTLRYFFLIYKKGLGGSPTRILWTDHLLQLTVILWLLTIYVLIY